MKVYRWSWVLALCYSCCSLILMTTFAFAEVGECGGDPVRITPSGGMTSGDGVGSADSKQDAMGQAVIDAVQNLCGPDAGLFSCPNCPDGNPCPQAPNGDGLGDTNTKGSSYSGPSDDAPDNADEDGCVKDRSGTWTCYGTTTFGTGSNAPYVKCVCLSCEDGCSSQIGRASECSLLDDLLRLLS